MHRPTFLRSCSLFAATAALMVPMAAYGQEGPNQGKVSLDAGVDVYSEYWFRGITQENEGGIVQPYGEVSISLVDTDNLGADLYAGTWNSWHFDNPSSQGNGNFWFESDLYAGVALDLAGRFGADISYINLYNPAGGGSFAEEIDLGLSFDDAGLWGESDFALSPSVTLAHEIDGGSDSGNNEGTYFEVGLSPGFDLNPNAEKPVSLSVPVTPGFSVSDYYEDGMGNDDTFGFLDIGAVASMPLTAPESAYGQWEASVGVHYITLGDSAAQIGNNFGVIGSQKDDSVYVHAGLGMSY